MGYNIFLLAGIVSAVFVLIKLAEQRFVDKEDSKPMKLLVRDALVVYISVVGGDFMLEQIKPFIEVERPAGPEVFVDAPDF